MDHDHRSGDRSRREERIRTLGYDPAHLTPEEQRQILELQRILPPQPPSAPPALPA